MVSVLLVYKIQRQDGLFSTGGKRPKWKKEGKLWNCRASLSKHLALFKFFNPYPPGTRVIGYHVEYREALDYPVSEHMKK